MSYSFLIGQKSKLSIDPRTKFIKRDAYVEKLEQQRYIDVVNQRYELTPSSLGTQILYLNASIPASYPGSGNIWYDTSGNNKNATLYNSPTYANNGITFSTSSAQYYSIPSILLTSQSFVVDVWIRAGLNGSAYPGYCPIASCTDLWSNPGGLPTGWGIGYSSAANDTTVNWGTCTTSSDSSIQKINKGAGPTLTVGNLYNLTLVRNRSTQTQALYVNGSLYSSMNLSNSASINSTQAIARSMWVYGSVTNNHTYYLMQMYKDADWSAATVLNNYESILPSIPL